MDAKGLKCNIPKQVLQIYLCFHSVTIKYHCIAFKCWLRFLRFSLCGSDQSVGLGEYSVTLQNQSIDETFAIHENLISVPLECIFLFYRFLG